MEELKALDIRKVTWSQIEKVNKLYANDQYMTSAWISRESKTATCLFLWTKKIIEYKTIMDKMLELGIRVKEDQIEKYKADHEKFSAVYDKFLIDYAD
mmetsp:Transcript_31396/g.35883  ORF Transcript_31396/g.35883 Transcript_31396/m.35883 type:complete len:98 (+) Transcript_31396:504-797(+)